MRKVDLTSRVLINHTLSVIIFPISKTFIQIIEPTQIEDGEGKRNIAQIASQLEWCP